MKLHTPPHGATRFRGYHELGGFRVRDVLLVSSPYDGFVLEEDGQIAERILSEYLDLDLRYVPHFTRVNTPDEAFQALQEQPFDLVISMTRVSDMTPLAFRARVKALRPGVPVCFLSYEAVDESLCRALREEGGPDRVFFWTGDARILFAVIKIVEDAVNVHRDAQAGVQVILVIEDSYRYYSIFLPLIYREIFRQTYHHIVEEPSEVHRLHRLRARPRILLAETFEQGSTLFDAYQQNLLGVISDARFPRGGQDDPRAGFRFAAWAKAQVPDLPFLVQSAEPDARAEAQAQSLGFLEKRSLNLLEDLRAFILSNFGFGDFVFRTPKGAEVARAANLLELADCMQTVPDDCLQYHTTRNHVSTWLRARTEFGLAEDLRPRRLEDYPDLAALREDLVSRIRAFNLQKQKGLVHDTLPSEAQSTSFNRIGEGSMGGKARGLAFMNALLAQDGLETRVPGARIRIPATYVVCAGLFEAYVEHNGLRRLLRDDLDDDAIRTLFLEAPLPPGSCEPLRHLLRSLHVPLAVRSSSLLEDCQALSFAGIYRTVMLPNNDPDLEVRLRQLCTAIRLVYASTFTRASRKYVANTGYRPEDEKMAVVIQELVGGQRKNYFYPVISGLARSFGFYAWGAIQPEDGMASLALGLGRAVVEGGQVFHYSPTWPRIAPPWSSMEEMALNAQTRLWALNLDDSGRAIESGDDLVEIDISDAEAHGTAQHVASTLTDEGVIRDTLSVPGARIVRFAQVVKYGSLPLNAVLQEVLRVAQDAFGGPVEIEFAADVPSAPGEPMEFALLQARPMAIVQEYREIHLEVIDPSTTLVVSTSAMGNGRFEDICDVIFTDPDAWDVRHTHQMVRELEGLNQALRDEDRTCVLIGFGRWASSDPTHGIPVQWDQITQARVFVEADRSDLWVEPSQGSHFFQNMVSLGLGYLFVRETNRRESIDWKWLLDQPVLHRTPHLRHVRLARPLIAEFDGRYARGVVRKPGASG